MSNVRRIAAASGVVAPVIAYGAILLATFLFQDFSWTSNALSHTGAVGGHQYAGRASSSAAVFNYGLILAGVVALPYLGYLLTVAGRPLQKLGVGFLALAGVSLSLVGVFPVGSDLSAFHTLAALGHYLSFTFGLWLYGTGSVLQDRKRWGLTTLWLGIVHLLIWIFWAVGAALGSPVDGLAVPEFLGGLIFGLWVGGTALRHFGFGPFLFD